MAGHAKTQERFLDEVRLARQITHPNICRIFDIGKNDGRTFISMELIDGENLATLLRRIGRLPADKAVAIGLDLCEGLHAIHERGILHRDLKPANLPSFSRQKVLRPTYVEIQAATIPIRNLSICSTSTKSG